MDAEKRIAILIDGDCGLHNHFEEIFTSASKHGKCFIKRVYGDITKATVSPWIQTAKDYSIKLENVINYTKGKNSTDSALIVDAMELLFTNKFDILCLVAGDSDYIRLIQRIQDDGKEVYGYGLKPSSQKYLVNACDKFEYLNTKDEADEVTEEETKLSEMSEEQLFIISYENTQNEDGFANMGSMKKYINRVVSSYEHKGSFSSRIRKTNLFDFDDSKQYTTLNEKRFLIWIYNQFNTKSKVDLGSYKKRILKYYKSYEYEEKSFSKHLESLDLFNLDRRSILSVK